MEHLHAQRLTANAYCDAWTQCARGPLCTQTAAKPCIFVARGDGSSVFSETLEAHNAAVNRYQRGGAIQPSNGAQAK
jgi:hypothetical protein